MRASSLIKIERLTPCQLDFIRQGLHAAPCLTLSTAISRSILCCLSTCTPSWRSRLLWRWRSKPLAALSVRKISSWCFSRATCRPVSAERFRLGIGWRPFDRWMARGQKIVTWAYRLDSRTVPAMRSTVRATYDI